MQHGDGIICRLCSKVIYNDYEKMENKIEILDSLSKLNVDIRRDSIICKNCEKILLNFLYFKRKCLDTENLIRTRLNSVNPTKLLYLEEVMEGYMSEDTKKRSESKRLMFCRFCLQLTKETDVTFLYDFHEMLLREMLQKILPELNLKLTKDPIICTACYESLQINYSFINNCLAAQRNKNEGETDYIDVIIFNDLASYTPRYDANVNDLEKAHATSAVATEVETNVNENIDNNIVIDTIVSKDDYCMDLLTNAKVPENIQNNQTELLAGQSHFNVDEVTPLTFETKVNIPMNICENYGANTVLGINSIGCAVSPDTEPGSDYEPEIDCGDCEDCDCGDCIIL